MEARGEHPEVAGRVGGGGVVLAGEARGGEASDWLGQEGVKVVVGMRFPGLEAPDGMAVCDPEAAVVGGGEPLVIFVIRFDGEDAGGGEGSAFAEVFGDERASGFEAEGDETAGVRVGRDGEGVLELVDLCGSGPCVLRCVGVP